MASVTIRNIDEHVLQRLRGRAARAGRSLEEELRRLLRRAANVDRDVFLDWVDCHRLTVPPDTDIVELIAQERSAR